MGASHESACVVGELCDDRVSVTPAGPVRDSIEPYDRSNGVCLGKLTPAA